MPIAQLTSVDMWYSEHGEGDPCVLLHPGGAGVDARALGPVPQAVAQHFHAYTPEQRAHGHTPDVDGPVTFDLMARDTIEFIESIVRRPVHLAGYSDGAIVALTVALSRPDLVRRLACVAGVFHRDGWAKGVLDGEPPDFFEQSYAEVSPDGADHYRVVVAKLAAMHAVQPALTVDELRALRCHTMVMVADDDQVRLEHALSMYRAIPSAELAVVPGTSHGLHIEKPELCNLILTEFLTKDPVATVAPIRRATQ